MPQKQHLPYIQMGLLEFHARFAGERDCIKYLEKVRFSKGFICPRCESNASGMIITRGLRQCKRCNMQVSITAGTIFHRTRTSLLQWFWAIYLMANDKRGHSALQLSKELNIPYARAWFIVHKIRSAMAYRDLQYKLDGIVEMDDTYFGAPVPGKRGRGTRRTKVLIAVGITKDNKPRFIKIKIVRRLDDRSVKAFACANITKGSVIHTDGLNIYKSLATQGFSHQPIVTPSATNENILYWTHIIISNAKAFVLGTFHGLAKKHLQNYLDEFCYRFNRRYHESELFDRLLLACAFAPPKTYTELTE